ncbi:MAG: tetratricopeptide repeat protein [Bacteroidales bacterium]|nr:tetratricopeptide repeat protein [Bacteroidales bacterium]
MNRFKYVIFIAILHLSTIIVLADGNESLFASANAKYADGDYQGSITAYEQILQTGQHSAELYYNLGNAYFKSNELTKAILNYERALIYSPADEDIKYNLNIANQLITDRITAVPDFLPKTWIKEVQNISSANTWGLTSLILFAITAFFVILFISIRRQGIRRLSIMGALLALILSISAMSFANKQKKKLTQRNTCIVFAPSVTVKSSPDDSGTNLFVIHEGIKLTITDKLASWFEIKMADGNIGWIPASTVETI